MLDHNPQNWLIYHDSDILVINKPAGVLSIPDGYHPEYPHLRSILEPDFGRLYIVHRLDKDTSGVMVLARTPEAHRSMNIQFDERTTRKEYKALILGSPAWNILDVEYPLTVNGDRSHRTRVLHNKGKPASTGFCVIKRWQRATLISATPHTGYTHQIRAHLGSIDYPILFDTLYTPPGLRNHAKDCYRMMEFSPDVFRPMLHACQISFIHPISGIDVEFSCPLPDDILRVINCLNKNKSGE